MAELDTDARTGLFARVRAADTALAVARAPEVVPWRFGRAVLDPVYRHSYDNNRLLVEAPLDGAGVGDLVAEADALMEPRGLAHRRIDNLDPADDARVRPGFEASGWRREHSTLMVLVGPPDHPVAADVAREVSWGELRATVETSTAREPYATDPEVVRQLTDRMERLRAAAATVRHFAVPSPDGAGFAAYCHLFLGAAPGCAQVEEVATLDEPWAFTPAGAGLMVGSGLLGLAYLLVVSGRAGGMPTDVGTIILAGVPLALFPIGLAGTYVAHRRVRAA